MGMMSGMGSVMGSGCGVYGIPELFFVTGEARIGAKHIGVIGRTRLLARLEEARVGILSARAGQGDQYQSIR